MVSDSASRTCCPRPSHISDTLSEVCGLGQRVSDRLSEIEPNFGHPVLDSCSRRAHLGHDVRDRSRFRTPCPRYVFSDTASQTYCQRSSRISGTMSNICGLGQHSSDTMSETAPGLRTRWPIFLVSDSTSRTGCPKFVVSGSNARIRFPRPTRILSAVS